MGKCEPALKSCQALGPEVRNCKGKEMGGEEKGDPEDVMEAQRSRGAGAGKNYSKAGAWEAQPVPRRGRNPQPWGREAAEQGVILFQRGPSFLPGG